MKAWDRASLIAGVNANGGVWNYSAMVPVFWPPINGYAARFGLDASALRCEYVP